MARCEGMLSSLSECSVGRQAGRRYASEELNLNLDIVLRKEIRCDRHGLCQKRVSNRPTHTHVRVASPADLVMIANFFMFLSVRLCRSRHLRADDGSQLQSDAQLGRFRLIEILNSGA